MTINANFECVYLMQDDDFLYCCDSKSFLWEGYPLHCDRFRDIDGNTQDINERKKRADGQIEQRRNGKVPGGGLDAADG